VPTVLFIGRGRLGGRWRASRDARKHPAAVAQLHGRGFTRRRDTPLTERKKGAVKGKKEGGGGIDIAGPRVIGSGAAKGRWAY
jgi:hypothetical protein